MKIISWNLRGICDPKRHKSFAALRKDLKSKIILLKEIKIHECKEISIKNVLWEEVDFAMVHVEGKFRGILCLWEKSMLEGRVIMASRSFCSILFSFKASRETFIITNVYAPTTLARRRISWSSLNNMREAFMGLYWIMARYFSVSILPSKKKEGVEGFSEGMNDFASFVRCNNLMDLDLNRFIYTWTNCQRGGSNIQAWLDRVLVSQDYVAQFGEASLFGYPINGSNHNPLLLETFE